jgi:squalene cyclase
MTSSRGRGTASSDGRASALAVSRSAAYLIECQSSDGLWWDFHNQAGASSEWVTAVVTFCAIRAGLDEGAVAAISALVQHQRADGGWGYNADVPSDSDSTAWVCAALLAAGHSALPALERARNYLLAHQDPRTGGFSTYALSDGIDRFIGWKAADVRGWCSAHTCVTATVLEALVLIAREEDAPLLGAAAAFLAGRQAIDGLWRSYWWSGVTYATLHALSALKSFDGADERLGRAAHALVDRQLVDGSWPWCEGQPAPGGAFETAGAVLALMQCRERADVDVGEALARGVGWLIGTQLANGKWPTEKIMQVPSPNKRERDLWKPRLAPAGGPRRFADIDSLFTTATALWALLEAGSADRTPASDRTLSITE